MYEVQRIVVDPLGRRYWVTVSRHELLGNAVRSAMVLSLTLGGNHVAILRPGGGRRTIADIANSAKGPLEGT